MADSLNIQNSLDQDIVLYDSYTSDGDHNYFGTLTSLGTAKAQSSLAITPIHAPVCVLIAMDTGGKPIGRYISMFSHKDIVVSEADVAVMDVALKFVDAITQHPDSDLAKKFNAVLNDKSDEIHVKAVDDFFAQTQDYKTCTFQAYMLALTYRARNPKHVDPSAPVEKQPYSLSALCQYLGGTWPKGFPDIMVTHFKCGTKNDTLFLGGHLTLSDLPFESSEIGKHVLALIPINQIEVEFFFHYGLDAGIFGIRIKFIAPDFHIPMGDDKSMVIRRPTVSLDIDPKFMFVVFKAYATIPFDIFGKKFDTKITMVLDNVEAEIGAVVDGDHSSLPFPSMYPGLHLDEFGVGMGIIFEPPSVAVGLQGKFHIGSGANIVALDDDTFVLVCAFEEEYPNPLYLAFYVPRMDLSTLINLFTDLHIDLGLPVSLQDLSFQWAENPMEPVALPDGSLTQMAFGCSGYLELFALQFYGNLEINMKGIQGTLTMAPLEMGKIFSITGDGKGVSLKVDAQGNPIKNNQIAKTKAEKDAIKKAKFKQFVKPGGPEITVSTSSSPYFTLGSDVSLLGLLHEDIETSISKQGISFELAFGTVLEGKMKCVLQDYHNFAADFQYGLDLHVSLPSIGGLHLGSIHLECSCEAGFSLKTSLSDITLEVHGAFDFEGLKLKFGPYSVSIDISDITGLIEAIGKSILKDAGHIFTHFISDAEQWAKLVAKGVITGVEHAAKVLKEAFKKTAKEVAKIMKTAGFVIKEIAQGLEEFFGLSSGEVVQTLLDSGYSQKEIDEGGITMPDNDSSTIMWSQFTQEIAAKLGKGQTEASIQVLPTAHLLSGKDGDEIGKSVNAFAAYLPQWGAAYTRSTSALIDAYQLVLTQIQETATSGKSVEAEYNAENKKLTEMMGKSSSYKVGKIKQWKADSQEYTDAGIPAPSFPDWFKDNGLQEYDSLLDQQKHQSKRVNALLSAQGIVSPVMGALQRMNDELETIKDSVAPPVTIKPDAATLAGWKEKPTNPGSIAFGNKSTHYDYSKTVWHSQSGYKLFGFISIGHRKETHSQESITTSSSSYNLEVEFAAQAVVNIDQQHWFDGAVLREFKNGPWVKDSQFAKAAKGGPHPYGQGGVLPLVPTSIYVVMNPKITITLDQSTYKKFKEDMHSSGGSGISLGCFAFGGHHGSRSGTHTTIDTNDQQQKITCTDKSNMPQIIAVVNQVMP